MAIDLGELIHDPDFSTTFKVIKPGEVTWVKGVATQTPVTITVGGIVAPSSSKDLELLPEGDRQNGLKTFYTDECPLDVTDTDATSDICIWRGSRYKLIHSFDYSDNGYYKAIGTLLGGETA